MNFHRINTKPLILIILCLLNLHLVKSQEIDQLLKSSKEYTEKGAYQQALNLINRAVLLDSTRADILLHRATINYYLGNYDKTIRDCYATLRFKPDVPEAYLLRGKVCNVTESYGGAILFFGKAMKYSSDNKILFDAFLNRGRAYFALNRFNDAFSDYQAAYAINQNSIDVLIALTETNLKLNKPNDALSMLNKVIASNPEYSEAYDLLGRIALENKDFPAAIQAYEKYTTLKPTDANAFDALANVYLLDKQYDKSMNSLNKSIVLDPHNPVPHKIRGQVYLNLGDNEKACNSFFRAMQLGYFEEYGYDLLDLYIDNCEK